MVEMDDLDLEDAEPQKYNDDGNVIHRPKLDVLDHDAPY